MFVFGSGVLLGARTDIANATPINFGLVQDVTMDISFDLKELYGQYQFPVAIARGKGKFTGKAKMARVSGIAFNNLFFGQTIGANEILTSFAESQTIPGTSTYTVAANNAAALVDDYGVVYSATGLPFSKVASGPTKGQYCEGSGTYTFSSSDGSTGVLLNYTYNSTSTSAEGIAVSNQLMGTTPTFQAQLYTTFNGVPLNVKFYNCVSSKLSFATKLDDFMIPEMDFSVYANAAGNVAELSFGEVS